MNADSHIFRSRWTRAKAVEASAFGLFRVATYIIIAAALYIFGDIAFKGGAVVFQTKAPFVNVPFLTEKPETLDIFTLPADRQYSLGAAEFQRLRDANDGVSFTAAAGGGAVTFSVPENTSLHVGNTVYRALVDTNSVEPLEHTTQAYAAGGIFPAIVGTVLLVVGSLAIALTLGILCAVYLSEYSKHGPFINFVRLSIVNLAGVPSIVFGMWGAAMFVIMLKWNISLMAGWFTLAFMVLPIIITGSEESLRAVPKGFRDGSLALGATKWQTITRNVLPYALPGILTSSIMGIARIAGETAAIMFTAAFVITDKLPWQVTQVKDFFFSGVMALPYHIFVVSAKVPQNEYTARVQYGTTFVFMVIIALIAMTSILLRARARSKYKW